MGRIPGTISKCVDHWESSFFSTMTAAIGRGLAGFGGFGGEFQNIMLDETSDVKGAPIPGRPRVKKFEFFPCQGLFR